MMREDAGRLLTDLDAAPRPWDYNPSSWSQRMSIAALGFAGAALATYLALYQWRLISHVWDPIFGGQSMQVLDSDVSERMRSWLLIPDAALGALGYLGDAIYGLAGSTRRWQYRPWMVILFGIDVIPLGVVSVILVVLQGTVVGSWCFICILTACISLALIVLAYDEIWSCLLFLHRLWRNTHDAGLLWRTIWGRASVEAEEAAEQVMQARRGGEHVAALR